MTLTPDNYHSIEARLVRGLSFDDYMNEDRPYLSKTTAKRLLDHSPLHAWTFHPALGKKGQQVSQSFDDGNIIEELVLKGGDSTIESLDFKDFRTNAAKEARDAARDAGRIPVLSSKFRGYKRAAEVLTASFKAKGYDVAAMEVQTSMYWQQNGVDCKGRLDCWWPEQSVIFDLKKIETLNERTIRAHITKYGYDIQAAAYIRGMTEIDKSLAGRLHFVLGFMELTEPYDTCLVPIRGTMLELGQRRWNRAVEIWKRCISVGEWPGMPRLTNIEPPSWMLESEMLEAISE